MYMIKPGSVLLRSFLFSLVGRGVGLLAWGLATLVAAGGHGPALGFAVAFPYSTILHQMHPGAPNDRLPLVMALVQMPIYGTFLGTTWGTSHRRCVVLFLVGVHVAAVALSLLPSVVYEAFW